MVIGIIGESCTGKSTLAEKIRDAIGAEIVSGKDYLRLAKSESEATALFRQKLQNALTGSSILYVIADPDQLSLLPDGAIRILVRADLDTIKARFRARMHGQLPPPVAQMLEKKHGLFDRIPRDYDFDSVADTADALIASLREQL